MDRQTAKVLGPNDFFSYTTKQVWTIISTHNGYVGVCNDLGLTVEGDTIGQCKEMANEAEGLLLNELKDDNMSITEYVATRNYYKAVELMIGGVGF